MLKWINTKEFMLATGLKYSGAAKAISAKRHKKQLLIVHSDNSKRGKPAYLVLWDTTTNQPATLADQSTTGEIYAESTTNPITKSISASGGAVQETARATVAQKEGSAAHGRHDIEKTNRIDNSADSSSLANDHTTGDHHEQPGNRNQNKADMADTERFLAATRTQDSKSVGHQKTEQPILETQPLSFRGSTGEAGDIGGQQSAEMPSNAIGIIEPASTTGENHAKPTDSSDSSDGARLLHTTATVLPRDAGHAEPIADGTQDGAGRDLLHKESPQDFVIQPTTGNQNGHAKPGTDTRHFSSPTESRSARTGTVGTGIQQPHEPGRNNHLDPTATSAVVGAPPSVSAALLAVNQGLDLSGEREAGDGGEVSEGVVAEVVDLFPFTLRQAQGEREQDRGSSQGLDSRGVEVVTSPSHDLDDSSVTYIQRKAAGEMPARIEGRHWVLAFDKHGEFWDSVPEPMARNFDDALACFVQYKTAKQRASLAYY